MKTQARTVYAHNPKPRRYFDAILARVVLCAVCLGMLAGILWSR